MKILTLVCLILITLPALADDIYMTQGSAWMNVTVVDTIQYSSDPFGGWGSGKRLRFRFNEEIKTVFLKDVRFIEFKTPTSSLAYFVEEAPVPPSMNTEDRPSGRTFYNPDGNVPSLDVAYVYHQNSLDGRITGATTTTEYTHLQSRVEVGLNVPFNRVTFMAKGSLIPRQDIPSNGWDHLKQSGFSIGVGLRIHFK